MSMYDRIKDVLVSKLQLNENEITPDSELVNDLGINSLELADLVMECEEEFDIEIDDNSIRGFVTVGDVAKYLESVVKEG
ncbi:MAG: acyl carrier protein [Eubacteriales bacterium]|nr:acyl carrier protein [Clostridiales bacterium]